MSFRENLQHLRSTRNMTQEQLAMLLGVSRQSVSKWEAEKAYPEMDKLIKLCDLFDCTLDDLVTGDLTSREPDSILAIAPDIQPTDVCGYDEVMLRTGRRIALGVGAILAAVGVAGFFSASPRIAGLSPDALPAFALFGGVAAGLALIIPASFERGAFKKAHPFVEDFYTPEDRAAAHKRLGQGIAVGVALILLANGLGASFGDDEQLAAISFFPVLAVGVALIVDAAMAAGRMNIDTYNDETLSDMTEAEIAALDDPDLARRARAKRRDRALYGAIMLVATAIALVWMFCGSALNLPDGIMSIFWLPWPIGGIACAIVAALHTRK